MILGYARVSTEDQNLNRQLDQLKEFGCTKIFKEKISGTKTNRVQLEKMIEQIREGDIIVITELARLSRNTKELFRLMDIIEKKCANIKSIKENWVDTTTPQGKFMFTIFAGISQFERDLISQRTKEGLAAARARGKKGGRPKLYSTEKIDLAIKMYNSKEYSLSEITALTGISKTSLYRFIASRSNT
ncbi:recombinase family protein [Clostridium estertheticum]|uniref:Recombinase family protein n=1 Tax=Clostridium estertheticum TaxID=238834 RepID=A0A7Y3WV31_9CLOT|nr:recombinase family protein [Clostridium estertheticum]MBW9174044.1 recombinase family protein [Clostridium estertheticum]NNU78766.1 recombinase family protein [Clostridium estertheticum]WBL49443.1 recombinase family protein [Clostridium estertheticum]WBL49642.1 recombinase family protein [Clostridium estertheticum]WBL49665.1 recombinase family protein [Clostridium estertheticum]